MISRILAAHCPGMTSTGIAARILAIALVTAGCTGTQEAAVQPSTPAAEAPSTQPKPTGLGKTDWKATSILGRAAGSADSTLSFLGDGQVAGKELVGDLLQLMGWVRKHLGAKGQEVRGIVLLESLPEDLGYAAAAVANTVEFKRYQLALTFESVDVI